MCRRVKVGLWACGEVATLQIRLEVGRGLGLCLQGVCIGGGGRMT